ncbi:hypothetical protein NQ315_007633 [Exocentrus adspersus]|uniref:Mediator of RNA polymerase II transcription subunit 25 n=1 Tax=Exocentrus adspersus TaxID=1586481 RepID=A0AAV8W8H9_9CUCU|nr:hypothetical protein NQ315_007633 [Exocentrus adspersus]
MVLCPTEHGFEVIFVIEGTALNGAYINDIKTNYIIPSLEYFSQGNPDEANYVSENANTVYGIVVYQAADCLPHLSSDSFGPFANPTKLLNTIDKLDLIGGKGESHANVAEGLATALHCFEELQQQKRDSSVTVQKHCILICGSPPYLLPVLESQVYSGKTAEQLAAILQEKNINLSVISPRKIPSLYKLFEKAGGDLTSSQTKNYAKDPRHLVLLKGFSLKERPISPPAGNVTPSQVQISNAGIPITSLPSPLQGSDSPIPGTTQPNATMLVNNNNAGVAAGVGPNNVYRPPTGQGINQTLVPPQKVNVAAGRMLANNQMPLMQVPAPPGYHAATGHVTRTSPHWTMPPPSQQQRPYLQQTNPQVNTTQSSALIAQLSQPPSSMSGTGVNQFGQMSANSPINKLNMNQPNVQTSIAQNPPGIPTSMAQVSQANQVATSQAQNPPQGQPQQLGNVRERHTIWQGVLEWTEKPKNPDQQKITKHIPCQVSANSKEGEPELKADAWPQKLIMQLMPKHLIGNIGGIYLKNSKSVLFHPQACDALESLTRVMSSGFAGCVHFTSTPPSPSVICDIKVLILLYTPDKRAYLGFIPNDQTAFVDRLRKVIQQQKSTQQQMRQGGPVGPSLNPQVGAPPQMGVASPVTSQNTQQNMLISQTNTISMGGGQITQNVNSGGQPGQGMGGMIGQSMSPGGIRPNIRMQGLQQGGNQPAMQPGMLQTPVQRAPFENQLEVERRQNLEKINQLKQTLEAAQQQEQQYKSQLERISHMKTSQLQEALQIAQQTEMQFKMLENQRQQMANQGNTQAATAQQQQRLMRPVMANNPGLRHLLQQQPQYRQQLLNMQQMGGNGPRSQMGQQMPNAGNNQSNSFDDTGFDFNII